ncbi:hypothetical protein Taro_036126 [Colocasia esculenta]|uniref:Uncharacterized protein n=1 Tax=Colocasia esculenta TaxID=4460 RepID=A0A843WKQ1_COLES|nr:hypothetical protein [Colocasia esculenta]
MEQSYDDDLMATFTRVVEKLSRSALDAADTIDQASINLPTRCQLQPSLRQMKSFREGVGSFVDPSGITGRDRIDGGGANLDDDMDIERLMLDLAARS